MREEDEAEDESSIMYVCLFFCSVIVVPVSSIIFKTFACVIVNDEGDAYLQYDLSQPCYNRQHKWWTLYAGLFVMIYPVSHSTI